MYVNEKVAIQGSFKGCLSRLVEGVWEVSSCFTQVNLRVTLGGEYMLKKE